MIPLKKIIYLVPFLLPVAIAFSRSSADIAIIFISILFLWKSYIDNNWEWANEKWFKAALVFTVYLIFFNSASSLNSFESLKYSIFFLRWPIFAMACIYWILSDQSSLKKFLISSAAVSLFLFFDTWYQYFIGEDLFGREIFLETRLTGPFRRPFVGMWITKLVLLPLLLFILIRKSKIYLNSNFFNYVLMICSALYFSTILITGERMAFLMAILNILILYVGLSLSGYVSIKKIILNLIFLLFISILFLIIYPNQFERAFTSSFEKILDWQNSDYGLVWKSAYDVWLQNPILGAGLHKYREACELLKVYGTVDNPISGGVCFHPHNITMQLLSETGIIGFILFYLIVFFIALDLMRFLFIKKEWFNFFIMFNILIACFLPIQSNTDFFSNKYSAIVWLLVGSALATANICKKVRKQTV